MSDSGMITGMEEVKQNGQMRPIITKALVVCLAVAVAPWLSGGQEPLGMLISGFALLLGALLVWRQPESRVLARGPLVVSFGLLIGFALLSLLWTANRYSSAIWIVEWVMAGLAFRLAYAVAATALGRKWVLGAYLISAGVFSVFAIWMYLTSEYGRLTGTFYWANPAAAYLIPAIVIGVDFMRRSAGRRQWAWLGATTVWATAFWLTDSRAATAVLFIILGLYLLLVKLSWRFWILYVFSGFLAFGLSMGLVKLSTLTVQHSTKVAPGSRFSEAIKGESTSGSDRLYFLGSALDMWFANPVGGVGAGTYGDVHPRYQKRVVSASTSAHNVYFQVLAELGLVGAALLAAVLLMVLLGSLRGLVAHPELVPVALGTLGLLMHMGLDIDARYPALLGLVGVFIGLMYAQKSRRWVALGWKWPAVAALVLMPVVSIYLSETWATRGLTAQADGDYALAAEDFGRADKGIAYNPDTVGAEGINLFVLGSLGGPDATANLSLALDRAHQAQRLDPDDGQHFQLEGRILTFKRDLKGAEAAFRRALALDQFNHPEYALDLAGVLVSEQKPAEALQVAAAMLAQYPPAVVSNRGADETLAPELANLEALVGNVYLSEGKVAEAKAAADRALGLDPKSLRGRALQHQVELILAPPVPQQ